MKIPCICIDDKNKPEIIPLSRWVKENEEYHITHVYFHKIQEGGIQGVVLYEKPLGEESAPYESFRITRFSFTREGIESLIELMKLCSELDDIDIKELTEELEVHEQD